MKLVVISMVLVAACGGKKQPAAGAADVDRYINTDLAPFYAKVLAARAGYDEVRADDIDEKPANTCYRIHDAALPLLSEALQGATGLTPPDAAKQLHADFLITVKHEKDAIAEMAAACAPINVGAFKAGHAKMMDAQEFVMSWDRTLQRVLNDNGVKLKPLPDVKIPEPQKHDEPENKAPEAPAVPAMCKDGTAKTAADGRVTCETEMMFAPPETVAGTPKEAVVACGPGELGYSPTGVLEGCVSVGKLEIGGVSIDKGAKITFGVNATVRKAVLPDGKQLCFDENAKPAACP